jgi:hypothetical protein
VNSTMLIVGGTEEIGKEQQHEFITTEKVSQKVY